MKLIINENCDDVNTSNISKSSNIILEFGVGMGRTFSHDQMIQKNISILSTNMAKKRNDMDYQMAKKYKNLYKMFKKKYKLKYSGVVRPQAIQMTNNQINKTRGNSGNFRTGVIS